MRTKFLLSKKFLLILLLFFLMTRLLHITADPPKDLSWSLGLFFDEGIYNHNARNQILFGEWKLDEWNDYYYSAISTWIKYLVMRVIGVGRIQIRLISIVFSMVSLLFVYLASRESYGKTTGLIALVLFGTNYISIMYSRLGMQDTQTLTIFIIAFYFWQKGAHNVESSKGAWYFFVSGATCFIGYTFKNLFIYLLPTPFVALGFYIVLHFSNKSLRNRLFKAFGYLCAGMFLAFLIWYVIFYLPNKEPITQFGKFFTKEQLFPTTRTTWLLTTIYLMPVFQYFSGTPVVLLGAFLFLLCIYYALCSERRSQINPADILLLTWFWAAFAFVEIITYRPTRYFLPIIPPMCILAARFIRTAGGISAIKLPKKLHWFFSPISIVWLTIIMYYRLTPWVDRPLEIRKTTPLDLLNTQNLIMSIGAAVLLTAGIVYLTRQWQDREIRYPKSVTTLIVLVLIAYSLYMDGRLYYQWARFPKYNVTNVGKELTTLLGSNAYIGGMDAPGVAYDTPYKTLISWDKYVNFAENPIIKYQLTHLFLSAGANNETHYYFRKYPREMQHATLLKQYTIKDTTFNLFSLVEARLNEIDIAGTEFTPQEPVKIGLPIKNHDFRQARELYLNWFLYPADLHKDMKPAGMGQEIHDWLSPGEERKFSVPGYLPEHSGEYQLLVSWDTVQEDRFEAEQMQRYVGQVIHDLNASGNHVVRHDPSAFPGEGFLGFGNYQDYHSGIYEATFNVKIEDNTIPDAVVRLDVVADYGRDILHQRELRGTDFSEANRYQTVILPFRLTEYTRNVEFRVFSYGKTDVWVDDIRLGFREGVWYSDRIVLQ